MDIVIIICSSTNCPTVICLPTVCYFSREKPLVKPTAPGSFFSYIFLAIYFFFAFLFRSIKPKKYKNTLLRFIFIYFIWRSIYQSITTFSRQLANFWRCNPKGIDNPFTTSGLRGVIVCVQVLFTLCCLVLLLFRY